MQHLDQDQLFNIESQQVLSNLVTRSSQVYDFDNIFELSHQLGSAMSSVFYNLLSVVVDKDDEDTLIINQMLEVFVTGFNDKYSALKNKDTGKVVIISASNKVH